MTVSPDTAERVKGMAARFEQRRGLWLLVWGLVILLGVGLLGLAVYAGAYQGDQVQCNFPAQYVLCYSHPYAIYELPLMGIGFLAILWGSAYLLMILGSRHH